MNPHDAERIAACVRDLTDRLDQLREIVELEAEAADILLEDQRRRDTES